LQKALNFAETPSSAKDIRERWRRGGEIGREVGGGEGE